MKSVTIALLPMLALMFSTVSIASAVADGAKDGKGCTVPAGVCHIFSYAKLILRLRISYTARLTSLLVVTIDKEKRK